MKKLSKDELLAKAEETLKRVAGICEDEDLAEAKYLVEALRDEALYEKMGALAEAVSRRDPKDARNRRLYGQYLINTGKATAAIDLLTSLAQRLPKGDPEFAEAMGLLGRANKQIFFDAGDKADPSARAALEQAIAAYRIPFEESPQKNTWHGVNLVALLNRTRRLGLQIAPDLSLRQVSKIVVAELAATPKQKRDPIWYLPTLAEASLGLGDWEVVEGNVRAYAASDQVRPFQIESTLRQFTQFGTSRRWTSVGVGLWRLCARGSYSSLAGRSKPHLKRCSAGASKLRRRLGSSKLFSAQRDLRPTSGGEPVSSARRRSAPFARNSANASAAGSC